MSDQKTTKEPSATDKDSAKNSPADQNQPKSEAKPADKTKTASKAIDTKGDKNAEDSKQEPTQAKKSNTVIQVSSPKPTQKSPKSSNRKKRDEKPVKQYFIVFRPFIAFWRYLRDSWIELCQVRWPNRKLTWKLTIAVLIYCAIFIAFVVILDVFFTFVFNLILGVN